MHCLYSSTQGPAVDFESSQRDHLPVNTYMATVNETHRTQTIKNQLPKEGMLAVSKSYVFLPMFPLGRRGVQVLERRTRKRQSTYPFIELSLDEGCGDMFYQLRVGQ